MFRVLEKRENELEKYKQIPYHIVFSCKFDLKKGKASGWEKQV